MSEHLDEKRDDSCVAEWDVSLREQLQVAFELSTCPSFVLSLDKLQFVKWNNAADVFFRAENLERHTLWQFVAERDAKSLSNLVSSMRTGKALEGTVMVRSTDGIRVLRVTLKCVGEFIVAVANAVGSRATLASLQDLDPLTGLMNRRVLQRRIELAMQRDSHRWGVLFIDLDRYKQVNDMCGHVEGDRVLVEFAQKLATSVRPGDLVCRYGGDEFVVLVDRIGNGRELREMADRIASDVKVAVDGLTPKVLITASIGSAMASTEFQNASDIIEHADRDMYEAKRRRRTPK